MKKMACHNNVIASRAKQSPPLARRLLAKGTLRSRREEHPRSTRRNDGIFILLLVAILFLTACTDFVSFPAATPVVAVTSFEVRNETPTPTLEPFRFTLPTPGAEPISGWRPPLYPVPWAMSPYDHFYFTRPIAADQVNWPLADYRYGGTFFAPNVVHTGVDIPVPEDTPIMAAGAGTVMWAGWGLFTGLHENTDDPYGQAVAIRHDFGYKGQQLFTVYAHMSHVDAVVGQHVETGDQIGLVGHTGATTGPHLHFEVRLPDNTFFSTYNPELWMAPPQGWGVLVGRVKNAKGEYLQQFEVDVRSEATKKTRTVKTYGGGATNHDPYYDENLVLGDLPAGIYKISFRIDKEKVQTWVEIYPGQVTFFTFRVEKGFDVNPPPTPTIDLLPVIGTPAR
jgi:murein DD-endopeptidase MepM/ murein hydrolase activator NlpD